MHTFITAGTSSIGQALVSRLTARGVTCTVTSRDVAKCESVYADNPHVRTLACDLLNSADVEQAMQEAERLGGPLTGLAHCLGSILIAPLHRTTDEQWLQTMQLNLGSAAFALRAFVKCARASGQSAQAVLISSCAADIGLANHEAVAAAKAGLEGLVRSAAATYAPDGIRINAVAPGLTRTQMAQPFLRSDALEQAAARQYPLNGLNEAADVADAMNWLLSPGASRITGCVIPVDGGFVSIRPLVK